MTTNLPLSDWPTVFPNAATATALVDRLVHHADTLGQRLPGDPAAVQIPALSQVR
jgi:DNA replication protein DnaC